MACQDLVTKRPGRKRNSPTNIRPELREGQKPWLSTPDLCRTPSRPESVSGVECSSTIDMYPDALMHLVPSLTSILEGISGEFDTFHSLSMHKLSQLD